MIGTLLAFSAYGQSNLPPCPKIDYSKNLHFGVDGRTGKWHNCFGRYRAELNDANKDDVMEGEWRNGRLNGQGTYYYLASNQSKGDKYVGNFKEGNFNGQGTMTHANGDKYVGEFKDDEWNGQGAFTFANGNKYVGEFKDGKQNGQGTFTRSNGAGFTGQWADGLPNGRGIETYADGRPANEGVFEKGKFVRAEKIETKTQAVTSEAASSSHCFSSTDEWVNSSSGREWRTIAEPLRQKLPEAKANPYAIDPVFWRDSMNIANSLVLKAKNIRFCKTNDQRVFDGHLSGLIEWRDHASELLRLWQNVETSYEKSIEGLNCPAYKEAQYKCATAGNPSYCIKVLFPAVNEMYANCR